MMRFIAQRALWGVLVVMSVVTLVFFLIFVAGDPAVTILGPQARAEQIADFKAKKGLDRPVPEQFMSYLGVMPCIRKDSPKYLGRRRRPADFAASCREISASRILTTSRWPTSSAIASPARCS